MKVNSFLFLLLDTMATREVARFHWADYLVFGISLIITIGIGIYHGCRGRKGNTEDYLMGSRDMSIIPVSLSLIVGYQTY